MEALFAVLRGVINNSLYLNIMVPYVILVSTTATLYVTTNLITYALFRPILPSIHNPYYLLLYPIPIIGGLLYAYTLTNLWRTRRSIDVLEEIHQSAKRVVKESLEAFYPDL